MRKWKEGEEEEKQSCYMNSLPSGVECSPAQSSERLRDFLGHEAVIRIDVVIITILVWIVLDGDIWWKVAMNAKVFIEAVYVTFQFIFFFHFVVLICMLLCFFCTLYFMIMSAVDLLKL